MRSCYACGRVSNSSYKETGVSYHKLPTNEAWRTQWVNFVKLCGGDYLNIKPFTYICSNHFTKDSFIENTDASRTILKFNAVPTILADGINYETDNDRIPIEDYRSVISGYRRVGRMDYEKTTQNINVLDDSDATSNKTPETNFVKFTYENFKIKTLSEEPSSPKSNHSLKRSYIRWTNALSLKLIMEYKKNEVLWNTKFPWNKLIKEEMKMHAWRSISENLNIDVDVIKRRMQILKASFRQEYNKIVPNIGDGSSDSKKSNWFAYDAMEFLTYNILGIQNANSDDAQSFDSPLQISNYSDANTDQEDMVISEEEETSNHGETSTNTASIESENDECITFGMNLGNKIKNYDSNLKLLVQDRIKDILSQADAGCFDLYPLFQNISNPYLPLPPKYGD